MASGESEPADLPSSPRAITMAPARAHLSNCCRRRYLVISRRAVVTLSLLAGLLLVVTLGFPSLSALANESGEAQLPLGYEEEDEEEDEEDDEENDLTPTSRASPSHSPNVAGQGISGFASLGQAFPSLSQASPYIDSAKELLGSLYSQSQEKVSEVWSNSREKLSSLASAVPKALRTSRLPDGVKASIEKFVGSGEPEHEVHATRRFPRADAADEDTSFSGSEFVGSSTVPGSSPLIRLLDDTKNLLGTPETLSNWGDVLTDYRKVGKLDFSSPAFQDLLQKLAVLAAAAMSATNEDKTKEGGGNVLSELLTSNIPFIVQFIGDFLRTLPPPPPSKAAAASPATTGAVSSRTFPPPPSHRSRSFPPPPHYGRGFPPPPHRSMSVPSPPRRSMGVPSPHHRLSVPSAPYHSVGFSAHPSYESREFLPSHPRQSGDLPPSSRHSRKEEEKMQQEAAVNIVSQAMEKLKEMSASGMSLAESKYEDFLAKWGIAKGHLAEVLQNGFSGGSTRHGSPTTSHDDEEDKPVSAVGQFQPGGEGREEGDGGNFFS